MPRKFDIFISRIGEKLEDKGMNSSHDPREPYPETKDPTAQEVINNLSFANQALQTEIASMRARGQDITNEEIKSFNKKHAEALLKISSLTKEVKRLKDEVQDFKKQRASWENMSKVLPGNRLNTVD